jgi:hypothetical protein
VFQQGRQGTTQGQEDFELSWYLFFQQSPLPSIGNSCLSVTPSIPDYQLLGLPRLLLQLITHNNHYRIAP